MDRTTRSATPRPRGRAAGGDAPAADGDPAGGPAPVSVGPRVRPDDDAPARGHSGSRSRAAPASDPLARIEQHLGLLTRTAASRRTMFRWCSTCPELRAAELRSPSQLPGWLRGLPTRLADAVLAQLVRHAQAGDGAALLAVLTCLAPGIRNLAARTPNGLDEVVSEVALGTLHFPVERRRSIAGGLLLDARNRLHRAARKVSHTRPLEDADHPLAPGELGHGDHSAQRAVQLVCQGHRQGLIDRTEACLILDTRVAGHPVKPVAHRLGLTPSAAYQRRHRAETRLTALVA